jgi:uncharacterized OB-fold protein
MSEEGTIIRKLPRNIERLSEEALSFVENIVKETGLTIYPDPRTGSPMWLDVRELRLRYTIPIKSIEEFFKGLREGMIRTTRCRNCGTIYFPPQPDCPRCRERNMEWIDVVGEGELVTWTVINVKPLSFHHLKDYTVGIVRMPQGFNILAWINVDDHRKLFPGMRMRLRVGRRNGEGYITYWFEPISG